MNKTSIEWTHRPETRGAAGGMTWNPIRSRLKGASPKARSGTFCTRISPGCTHCYAAAINKRFGTGLDYTVPNLEEQEFFIDERILEEPLKQKKPCTIFVGDMFDLFHEAIHDHLVADVFDAMENAPQHTYQLLTKRAANMHRFIQIRGGGGGYMPNVWLGVSVESQQYADERIPLLLDTPAAVRFLSVEPLLSPVKLDTWLYDGYKDLQYAPGIDWVICGGESGHRARPFNLTWAESLLKECREAGVPFFMKQIGGNSYWFGDERLVTRPIVKNRKGGDPSEWPEHLRVREFPTVNVEACA